MRFAWEQAGLPALVRRSGAQVLHSPHYTMPLRRRRARRDDAARRDVLHPPRGAPAGEAAVLPAWTRDLAAPGAALRDPVGGHPRRARARRRCPTPTGSTWRTWASTRGASTCRRTPSGPPSGSTSGSPGPTSRSSARSSRGRTRPGSSAAGCRPSPARPSRRRWCWPVAAAGTTTSTGPSAEVPEGLTLLRPGYLPLELLAGLLGRGRAGRLSEPGGGLRAAGARGHGQRRGRAHHPAAVPARGRRGRRGVHRARPGAIAAGAARAARRPGPPPRAGRGRPRPGGAVRLAGLRARPPGRATPRPPGPEAAAPTVAGP